MTYRIGIDIGGTFTDFALLKEDAVVLDKTLSTPRDRSLAVMSGLEKLASREDLSLGDFLRCVESIVHGTTVADNTLIEMDGAVTGLLTTEGFRDELELRRGFKEDIWDVRLAPPAAIVPRRRRLGVPERVRFDGHIHQPLDEAAARRAIRRLAKQGVESVAICTLFSFVNPVHERRLAELVADELPDALVSLSCEVLPKAPEFERVSTTAVNAYIAPRVTRYLDRLIERLRDAGYRHELMVMQASGGVMTREYLRGSPVRLRRVRGAQRQRSRAVGLELAPPLPGRRADGAGRDAGRWRRLHLSGRRRRAARRPRECWRRPRARVLWAWWHTPHRDRREPLAGPVVRRVGVRRG
jgi:N-methylhydantoinase A